MPYQDFSIGHNVLPVSILPMALLSAILTAAHMNSTRSPMSILDMAAGHSLLNIHGSSLAARTWRLRFGSVLVSRTLVTSLGSPYHLGPMMFPGMGLGRGFRAWG